MASKKIDINIASLEDLESLIGIGHAKAEAIIEARKVTLMIELAGGFTLKCSTFIFYVVTGTGPV